MCWLLARKRQTQECIISFKTRTLSALFIAVSPAFSIVLGYYLNKYLMS